MESHNWSEMQRKSEVGLFSPQRDINSTMLRVKAQEALQKSKWKDCKPEAWTIPA